MIVLINPRLEASSQPPLGLAYLASYLKSNGNYDVQIIDMTFERLEDRLRNVGKVELFGIYIMTPYYRNACRTIEILKERFEAVPIVVGGPHPTANAEEVLNKWKTIICARGEGEQTLFELVNAIKQNSDLSGVNGISYIDPATKQIIHTPDREKIKNLDILPFPARELLPMKYYLQGGIQKTFSYRNIRTTTMITSRGCPFNCTYCQPTLDRIFGKKLRFRSVENVIDEISQLIKDYSIQGVFFLDDTFTCKKVFVMEFCREIIRKKINLKFAINSRVDTVDEEMLAMLSRAGVVTIMYGIESGNQNILDNINKKTTLEKIRNTVINTKKVGINVYGYFMLGSTEETLSSMRDTLSIARGLPFDEVQFSMATPYVGTYLYDEASSLKLIENRGSMEENGYFSSAIMRSRHLSTKEIKKFHRICDILSKYKSIKNMVLKYPSAIPHFFINKILRKWKNKDTDILSVSQ